MSKNTEVVALCIRNGLPVRIWRQTGDRRDAVSPQAADAASELARLAETHPGAYIAWFDERVERYLDDVRAWPRLVRHPLEILHLSCLQRCDLMAQSLGLVDFDSPFLLPGPTDRRFPTWLVSPLGGIGLGSAFRAVGIDPGFKDFAGALFDFGYRGLRYGLCPYSEPRLVDRKFPSKTLEAVCEPLPNATVARLIRRCFGRKWLLFWAAACGLAHKPSPWIAAAKAAIAPDARYADLPLLESLHPKLPPGPPPSASVAVVVATLGRPGHVRNLLQDLAKQTVPPQKVILVEQDPDGHASRLSADVEGGLPFELEHQLVPWVGACRARNEGLRRASSEWILLLDDDVRLRPGLIAYLLKVAAAYRVQAVNAATYLPGQQREAVAELGRVWPACGTAGILLDRELVTATGFFDERLEGGYGEDYEFGLRLRLNGGNIFYAPGEPILHLKAAAGGFRQPVSQPWAGEDPQPRPSPVFLYSRAKHATESMQKGYQLYYWLKRLAATPIHRWAWEIPLMRRQWRTATGWVGRLGSKQRQFSEHLQQMVS